MFAERLICSWIGALGLAAGAFCQTYIQISADNGTIPESINKKGEIAGYYNEPGIGCARAKHAGRRAIHRCTGAKA